MIDHSKHAAHLALVLAACAQGEAPSSQPQGPDAGAAPDAVHEIDEPDAADSCAGIDCSELPEALCVDATTLRTYSAGTCADGSCTYGHDDVQCESSCEAGVCVSAYWIPFDASSCQGVSLGQSAAAEFFATDASTSTGNILVESAYYLYSRQCTSVDCGDWQSDELMSETTNLTMGVPVVALKRSGAGSTITARWHGYVQDEWRRASLWESLPLSSSYWGYYERYVANYPHSDELQSARFDLQNTALTNQCFRSEAFYNTTPSSGGDYTEYKWVAFGVTDAQIN